jgi:hypothetical protein
MVAHDAKNKKQNNSRALVSFLKDLLSTKNGWTAIGWTLLGLLQFSLFLFSALMSVSVALVAVDSYLEGYSIIDSIIYNVNYNLFIYAVASLSVFAVAICISILQTLTVWLKEANEENKSSGPVFSYAKVVLEFLQQKGVVGRKVRNDGFLIIWFNDLHLGFNRRMTNMSKTSFVKIMLKDIDVLRANGVKNKKRIYVSTHHRDIVTRRGFCDMPLGMRRLVRFPLTVLTDMVLLAVVAVEYRRTGVVRKYGRALTYYLDLSKQTQ